MLIIIIILTIIINSIILNNKSFPPKDIAILGVLGGVFFPIVSTLLIISYRPCCPKCKTNSNVVKNPDGFFCNRCTQYFGGNYNDDLKKNINVSVIGELRLAQLHNDLGSYNGAIEYYKNAIKLDPNNLKLHHALSMAYIKIEDYRNAIKILKHITFLEPNDSSALLSMGIALNCLGDIDESVKFLQKSARLGDERAQSICENKSINWL